MPRRSPTTALALTALLAGCASSGGRAPRDGYTSGELTAKRDLGDPLGVYAPELADCTVVRTLGVDGSVETSTWDEEGRLILRERVRDSGVDREERTFWGPCVEWYRYEPAEGSSVERHGECDSTGWPVRIQEFGVDQHGEFRFARATWYFNLFEDDLLVGREGEISGVVATTETYGWRAGRLISWSIEDHAFAVWDAQTEWIRDGEGTLAERIEQPSGAGPSRTLWGRDAQGRLAWEDRDGERQWSWHYEGDGPWPTARTSADGLTDALDYRCPR